MRRPSLSIQVYYDRVTLIKVFINYKRTKMPASKKKRALEEKSNSIHNEKSIESNKNKTSEKDISEEKMIIQVDFEARTPEGPDYHGIKNLLSQLFLKAHLDLGELTNLIISQNFVSSVVKQACDEPESDEEEDDFNDIYGVTSIIDISNKHKTPCIQQMRELLKQLTVKHASHDIKNIIQQLLEKDTALGLLINERFINIPLQISVPLLENLISEMNRAISKKKLLEFSYVILICKLYKINEQVKKSKNKNLQSIQINKSNFIWSNPEEEIIAEEAIWSFEFSVEKESDLGLDGTWTEDDNEMIPVRRVLFLEYSKLPEIVSKIKMQVQM